MSVSPICTPHVVTLGTAGGPRWYNGPGGSDRHGISTAVVIAGSVYLVDCGQGTGRQMRNAGLSLGDVRGIFITHLHSDHVTELASLMLFSPFERKDSSLPPIPVYGPGPRGKLPPLSRHAMRIPEPVAATAPTPGTREMVDLLVRAHATDFNDRIFDARARSPRELFDPYDITLPEGIGFDPDDNVAPEMDPIEVFDDGIVRVTAILVAHAPMAPAFAFRFDSAEGSVTISGDTAPCENLVRLARNTDLLLHEAIDLDGIGDSMGDTELARATLAHHRRSHTTPRQAGEIAARAGARSLALHHLCPPSSPPEAWLAAGDSFAGQLYVPDDLDVISFASDSTTDGDTVAAVPQYQ